MPGTMCMKRARMILYTCQGKFDLFKPELQYILHDSCIIVVFFVHIMFIYAQYCILYQGSVDRRWNPKVFAMEYCMCPCSREQCPVFNKFRR